MHFSRSVLYLFLFFLFPFFSCKKVQDVITQTFSPEIKINQEFEFIFKEYAKQRLKEYNIDTTGINIDNLPANVYFALQQFIKLDTVGIDSFEIDQLDYIYKYALADLDSNLSNNPVNVLKFKRSDISSAKVDSSRLYLLPTSPLKQEDFKLVRISASNNSIPSPLSIVNANSGFVFQRESTGEYANLMRLPVINPDQQFSQYMIPPNDSINYIFRIEFNKPIKFSLNDKYKLAFNYKFVFRK